MYIQIENTYKKRKSFFGLCFMIAAVMIVMIVLTIQGASTAEPGALIFSFAFMIVAVLAVLFYCYINIVTKTRRQFIEAVEKAYPESASEIFEYTR